jgi:hypothetical protein
MKKTRNRRRPSVSLRERLQTMALRAREKAALLPPNRERDRLIQSAISADAAAEMDRWLSSAELQPPK